jgi:ribosomal protein S12 methylthiotransferase
LGTGDYQALGDTLRRLESEGPVSVVGHQPGFLYTADINRIPLTPLYSRYVKISEGCDHTCSFCVIPSFRGKHRSRAIDDIVREVRRLVSEGAREVVLTGQDTTYFGVDTHGRPLLARLLKELDDVESLTWIRLLYAYPTMVNDKLIEAIRSLKHVCHYIDMPLQHISDPMLRRMRRGTTELFTRNLIKKLRSRIPDIAIRTTFIVGHPGETEEDHAALKAFMQWAQFERLGIFRYSREDGSVSETLAPQVPGEVSEQRRHELMVLQQDISIGNNAKLMGKELEVLIEGPSDEAEAAYRGRCYMDAPEVDGALLVTPKNGSQLKPGQFVDVSVTGYREYDLIGAVLEK